MSGICDFRFLDLQFMGYCLQFKELCITSAFMTRKNILHRVGIYRVLTFAKNDMLLVVVSVTSNVLFVQNYHHCVHTQWCRISTLTIIKIFIQHCL